MKKIVVIIAPFLYVIGFLVYHIHLFRFGIFEISSINLLYFIVSILALSALIPSILLILLLEVTLWLSPTIQDWKWKRKATAVTVVLLFASFLFFNVDYMLNRHGIWEKIFNFNFYIYPKRVVVNNIIVFNVELLLVWFFILALKKGKLAIEAFNIVSLGAISIFIFLFSTWFGRTIYPTINAGIGGGAPMLTEIYLDGDDSTNYGLLLYQSSNGIYYYPIDSLTDKLREFNPLEQYIFSDSIVQTAVLENFIAFTPKNKIEKMVIFGGDQKELFEKYRPKRQEYGK